MLDRAAHLERWRELHHGYDPARQPILLAWLAAMHVLAAPLARRSVSPDGLTFVGGALAALSLAVTHAGGRWLILSALLLVASAVLDGLDGAVAVLSGRESARGARLDRLVDRFGDLCSLGALVVAGAPRPAGALAAAGVLLMEGLRARGAARGWAGLDVVTPGERPTRLVLTTSALLAVGALPQDASAVTSVALITIAGLCAISSVVLVRCVRRGC